MPAVSLPAPVGGWNARDSWDAMAPEDAILLENWIPGVGYCKSRKGFTSFCTGLGGNVETLAEYAAGGVNKFLAAANSKIFEISTGTASELGTGYSNNRWQSIATHDKLILFNGSDGPLVYDGSTLGSFTDTDAVGASGFTGGGMFKQRAFYFKNNAQSFFYANAGAFQGNLTEFDLSLWINGGGNLVNFFTWTRDSGDGMDDLAVFVFSSGEALVYQGSDPSDANDWSLVGRFSIGEPLSFRSHARLGGDEVVLTKDGWLNIESALSNGRVMDLNGIGGKIVGAAKEAATTFGGNYGWECLFYPKGNMLIVNVPRATNSTYVQHVMNTNTGQWCLFSGMNARTFGLYRENLYFGGNGVVYRADDGSSDDGEAIDRKAIPAFFHFENRARQKQLTAVQPVTDYSRPGQIAVTGGADYRLPPIPAAIAPTGTGATTPWGSDWGSEWGGESFVTKQWASASAFGYAITYYLRLQAKENDIKWYATDLMYNLGGTV